jgi:hypothetical protein
MLFAKHNQNDVEEEEMGRACSTDGEKRISYRILMENQKELYHLEDLIISGRIILK